MIRAVFFDVGDTLIHTCPSVAAAFARVAARRGHNLALREVEACMPTVDAYYEAEYLRDGDFWCSHEGSVEIWLEQYRYLCELTGIGHDAEGMAQEVHRVYSCGDGWRAFEDVEECLRTLKRRGYALGVVSNWDIGLEELLCELRLLPYFDVVISSAVVGYRKPNPVIFDLACEELGILACETVHVGDRPDADGDGAFQAGIRPVIIDRHGSCADCAYERIGTLEDLPELICALEDTGVA